MQARSEWASDADIPFQRNLPIVLGLPSKKRMITLLIVSGTIMLPLGANLLIDGAVGIGERFGISNQVIGLTVDNLTKSASQRCLSWFW